MYLCEIDGGNLRNAIAREAHAVIAIPEDYKHDLRADLNIFAAEVQAEYAVVDPGLQLILESENPRAKAIDKKILRSVCCKASTLVLTEYMQ